ncbi:PaaI family thioesterase [Citromicrobium bathyomarinum]|uniref:PaaI family thioesterase n=1 Tax=Citromicrobium TaxID=72173 RepID=UPI000225EDD2|nr:PaaI family thioesterase [Citromicrobium sp. JLT1363]
MTDEAHPDLLSHYARSLGIEVSGFEDNVPVLRVSGIDAIEGRPDHFHGGATSGLMETAAYAALRMALSERGEEAQLKPINITVQFLAAAKKAPLFAKARITKLGRRSANVTVEAWQEDRERPRASAVMNVMIQRDAKA